MAEMNYEPVSRDGFDEFSDDCVITPVDGGLLVSGTCRNCDHATEQKVYQRYVRRGWLKARRPASSPEDIAKDGVIPFRCQCEEEHRHRPKNKKGCGAYWRIKLTDNGS